MARTEKKNPNPPQMKDLVEGFNAMAGVVQQQGEALRGVMGFLGLGDNGSQGDSEAVAVETDVGEGDAAAQSRRYPYGFGQDQARIELAQLAFNIKDAKLPQFTETPRSQVQPTAALEAYDIYIGNMQKMAVLQSQATILKRDAMILEKKGDVTAASSMRASANALLVQAEATYEPMESIFIRCRDKRMLSVSRRSRMEILKFNEVQQERQQVQEGQEAGF